MVKIDGGVCASKGFTANGIHCGIRKNKTKRDLALIFSEVPANAAAVYTQNLVKGAPLTVTKNNISDGKAQAVICNSGNANTCNANGIEIAEKMCELLGAKLGISPKDVVVASTGVIGQPLDITPIANGIDPLVAGLGDNSTYACEGIMTTDVKRKEIAFEFEINGVKCHIGGIAKGSGMIHPNMATMLVFVTTDCKISSEMLAKAVSVRVLPDVYPVGDEITLIYESLGRLVAPGKLPITVGVIVYNVETMYNLGRVVLGDKGVYEKWLTVGGDIDRPVVVKVPIGTPVSSILARLSITVGEDKAVIDGGPSMGRIINPDRETVNKTTSGILILPRDVQAVQSKLTNEKMAIARAETACCQCTRCTDMCPRALLGYPLEPHRMVRTAMGAVEASPIMVLSATLCCGCGICESLACNQGISPRAVINNYKALLAKNKMRYTATGAVSPLPERDYRMIPSDKWAYTIGIKRFDRVADYIGKIEDIDRVRIPLGRHIGAPSMPVVKTGDSVSVGEVIAVPGDGLSVAQHASIAGQVSVFGNEIIIDKVK